MFRIVKRKLKKHKNVCVLIIFGFMVHALILMAALDIYFSSPIDHGMKPIKSTLHPPARRVVFIVADGLRAEAIYGNNSDVTPNLHNIRKTRGSWGIAHTRVPTESRPGHVALLGGIYEDPAAILKGWQSNPVDFDSVINQSANAYCWGGPTIINMFNKDNSDHIYLDSYDPNWEDYGKNSTIALDQWVFDQLRAYVNEQYQCSSCFKTLKQQGNFIFLHLLGTDTAGHAFKPESEEYKNNIRFVDSYIPQIENFIEYIFNDRYTAYVFTSDHGMTNWGSHGSGSDHETQTPIIAWGAGIKVEDRQKDIRQIDVATLLSALIGINYPINNLGRLPADYIATSTLTLHEMILSNVKQLIEIFKIKKHRLQESAINFRPYRGFLNNQLDASVQFLQSVSDLGDDDSFRLQVNNFIDFLIEGTDYYHYYYQLPILISVAVGLVEWIVYLAVYNVKLRRHNFVNIRYYDYSEYHRYVFACFYLMIAAVINVQHLPWMYYCYFLFPMVMAQLLAFRIRYIVESIRLVQEFGLRHFFGHLLLYLTGLKLLVNSFSSRETLSVTMFVVAGFASCSNKLSTTLTKSQKMVWVASCVGLVIFPYMPVMETTFNLLFYLVGYIFWCMIFKQTILHYMDPDVTNKYVRWQFLIFKLTPIYTLAVEKGFVGAESPIKYIAWIWAAVPLIMIPFSNTKIFTRLTSIFLGCGTYYLMVTSNFEMFFLGCFITNLLVWLKIESICFGYSTIVKKRFVGNIVEDDEQSYEDFRRAFFFVVFVFFGFFGTGNIASLSSFDPMWVRCFLTIFRPFLMSILILLRIAVPFVFVTCVYRAVNLFRKSNTLHMFCIVLMFSDVMLLVVLFNIKNVGSWLEIGMSLSHFLIMEGFVIILLLLYGFAFIVTTVTYYNDHVDNNRDT